MCHPCTSSLLQNKKFPCTKSEEVTPFLLPFPLSLASFNYQPVYLKNVSCRKEEISSNLPPKNRAIDSMIAWDCLSCVPTISLWKHPPGFQGADRLILCDVLPRALTCNPLSCWVNTMPCVDGDGSRMDHISSRSRKWELEGSCYQAPSFLQVLHGAKLKPCVFSPCGPLRTAGLTAWLASDVVFLTTCDLRKHSAPPFRHCYLNPPSV